VEIKGVTAATPQRAAAAKLRALSLSHPGGDNGSGASSALYYVRYHDSLRF